VKNRVIGRYRFLKLLGKGAMGEVHRAHDAHLRRDVAIKILDRKLYKSRSLRQLFLREAQIQARLEHPNIVSIYDILERRRRIFLVMRFVEGDSVDRMLTKLQHPLPATRCIDIFRAVLKALDFAHRRGVVHRDIKPANIMIDEEATALVLDFGVAGVLGIDRDRGKLIGSPAYMAPEQVKAGYVDSRADIYSLGMSLYWTLTRHHPFENARDLQRLLRAQVETDPAPPSHYNPELPKEIDPIVLRALEKDPRDRFRSCHDFSHALALIDGSAASAEVLPDSRWDPRAPIEIDARRWQYRGDQVREGRTLDLSPGGCLLWTDAPPEAGMSFYLELVIEDGDLPVQTRARVAWTGAEDKAGFTTVGLRFTELDDEGKERIASVVREALVLGVSSPARDLRDTLIMDEEEYSQWSEESEGSEGSGHSEHSETNEYLEK